MEIKSLRGWLELAVGVLFIVLAKVGWSLAPLILAGAASVLLRAGWAAVGAVGLPKRLTHVGLVLFLISALVGVRLAYDLALSWPSLAAIVGGAWLFYALLDIDATVENQTALILIAGALFSLWFISAYSTFGYEPKLGIIHRLGRAIHLFRRGTFGRFDRNAAAAALEGLFLLGWAMLMGRRQNRRIWAIIIGLISYGLLLTVSRGAWIALGLATLLWLGARLVERGVKIGGLRLVIGLLGLVILIGVSIRWLPPAFFTDDSGRSQLFSNEGYLWRDTWLFGIGLGQPFTLIYSRFVLLIDVPYLRYAHNIFVQIGLGQGLLGLIGFGLLLLGVYFDVGLNRPTTPTATRSFFDAAYLGVAVILVHGLVDATQFIEFLSLPSLFILLALTSRCCLAAGPQLRPPQVPRLLVGLFSLFLVIGLIGWRFLAADFYVNIGALNMISATLTPDLSVDQRQLKRERAVHYLQQALRYDADHSGANRWLGLIASRQGDYAEAVTFFEEALPKEPNNFTLWKGLGYAYLWEGEFEAANQLLIRVPEAPVELGYWAQWWRGQKQFDRAQLAFDMQQALR